MNKEAYEKQLEAQLDQWKAKIDTLKAKAKQAESGAEVKYYETIEDLKQKQTEAEDKLQELRQKSDEAWEDMKAGIEKACSSLGAAVKSAISEFK